MINFVTWRSKKAKRQQFSFFGRLLLPTLLILPLAFTLFVAMKHEQKQLNQQLSRASHHVEILNKRLDARLAEQQAQQQWKSKLMLSNQQLLRSQMPLPILSLPEKTSSMGISLLEFDCHVDVCQIIGLADTLQLLKTFLDQLAQGAGVTHLKLENLQPSIRYENTNLNRFTLSFERSFKTEEVR